jgi:uncharacterized OB-fold protein
VLLHGLFYRVARRAATLDPEQRACSSERVRPLPELTELNRHFWQGGRDSELRFLRCQPCRTYIHPPAPICPACLSRELAPEAVSGRGVVVACTVNHQPWAPGESLPYSIAIVELSEQAGLRLTTNVVGCAPESVRIGMPVRVRFQQQDDVWLPLFEPVDA